MVVVSQTLSFPAAAWCATTAMVLYKVTTCAGGVVPLQQFLSLGNKQQRWVDKGGGMRNVSKAIVLQIMV